MSDTLFFVLLYCMVGLQLSLLERYLGMWHRNKFRVIMLLATSTDTRVRNALRVIATWPSPEKGIRGFVLGAQVAVLLKDALLWPRNIAYFYVTRYWVWCRYDRDVRLFARAWMRRMGL